MAYLTTQPWEQTQEYFAKQDGVLIAFGAIHGHDHIPQGIDIIASEHLVDIIEKRTGILVAPSIAYGPMPNYMGYPGCVSPRNEIFFNYTLAVVMDLFHWGARRFYFMNGHGGNTCALQDVSFEIRKQGGVGVIFEWWRLLGAIDPELDKAVNQVPENAPKGIRSRTRGVETAVAAALIPEWEDKLESARIISSKEIFPESPFETNYATGIWFKNVLVPARFGSRETTVIGDVGTKATADMGRKVMDACANYMIDFIDAFNSIELPAFKG